MRILYQTSDDLTFYSKEEAEAHEARILPIVLVDDEPEIAEMLKKCLIRSGYAKVVVFTDPLVATNFISKNDVLHVFSDYNMPMQGMSGKWIFDLCSERNIPFTYVSGDTSINGSVNKIDFLKNTKEILDKIL
jgi:DNA-binding NtrC family response regulator